MVKMNEEEQEITRLCRIIGEDKTTIAKLKTKITELEEVIEKQNDLIETLWELYTDD